MQILEKYLTHKDQNLRKLVKYILESHLKSSLLGVTPAFDSFIFEFEKEERYLQVYPLNGKYNFIYRDLHMIYCFDDLIKMLEQILGENNED